MTRTVFFRTAPNGRGASLFSLPGQLLSVRKRMEDNMMTHGCEAVRRRYPVGTVFYTSSDRLRFRRGCYHTDALRPLLLPDGTPVTETPEDASALQEYYNINP